MTSGQVAGFLHRLDEERGIFEILRSRDDLTDWTSIVEDDWFSFTWKSAQGDLQFLLREGRDRFLLLSTDHLYVVALLELLGLAGRVRKPRILVSKFVRGSVAPVNQPQGGFGRKYRISNVFSAVDGYGRSLQTIGLWGDDLLNAELFTYLLEKSRPYRVTVRELRGSDIVSISSTGDVNFHYAGDKEGAKGLARVDTFLRHLKREGLIRWGTDLEQDTSDLGE